MKNNFSYLTVLLSIFTFGQNNPNQEVKRLLKLSDEYYKKHDYLKSLEHAKKSYNISTEIGDDYLIAESCDHVAVAALYLDLYDNALIFTEKGLKHVPENQPFLRGKLHSVNAYILGSLGLEDLSLKKYYVVIKCYNHNKDNPKAMAFLSDTYQSIATIYNNKNLKDSVAKYEGLSEMVIKKLPVTKDTYASHAMHYFHKGETLLFIPHKEDSAFVLFSKAVELKKKFGDSNLYMEYIALGDYYYQIKNYPKTLEYYKKSIENIETHNILEAEELMSLYEDIANIYASLGDTKNQQLYLRKYIERKNSIEIKQKKSVDYALKIILEEKSEKEKSNYIKNISLITTISMATIILIYILYRKTYRKKKEIKTELQRKEETIEKLEHRAYQDHVEIMELAKAGNVNFWQKFHELYPEFKQKLQQTNPKITNSELILAAYVHLGFTTAETANFTYRSLKTIESTRYNLRKKLQLSSEINLRDYLKKIIE